MENKIVVAPKLLEFLVAWLKWATSENPESDTKFQCWHGLCAAYSHWCRRETDWKELVDHNDREELVCAFRASGLDIHYPFGEDNYDQCSCMYSQHLDPARLAWVRKVISDNSEVE